MTTDDRLEPASAIVLAGRRPGPDPLAEADGATHRALLDIEGEAMLLRVVRRLLGRPGLERVFVNIDRPALLDDLPGWKPLVESGRAHVLPSTPSPSQSVLESLDAAGLDEGPVLVTTADHALLDDDMLDAFLACAHRDEPPSSGNVSSTSESTPGASPAPSA